MNPFQINLVGEIFTVERQDEDRFAILKLGIKVCDVWSKPDAEGITIWSSSDPVSEAFVKQLGELIEEHEM